MRVLFVVQRYGPRVRGGAESLARSVAERLAAHHEVEVVSSCATDYMTWQDELDPGSTEEGGVVVHRLPVRRPRQARVFDALNRRIIDHRAAVPAHLQRVWMAEQGPRIEALPGWLARHGPDYDVVVFFTYLYWSTWAGLAALPATVPSVLHPLAHDEPHLYLGIFDPMMRRPHAFAFLTPEEEALVARRFRPRRPGVVTGVGVDVPAEAVAAPPHAAPAGTGGDPYLLYVGRVDPSKGTDELHDYFAAYKRRNPGTLRLRLAGELVAPPQAHPDIDLVGPVDDEGRRAAVEGCVATVVPSYFESFSLALTEAWAHGRPGLVQGRCDVLDGQARRSGGAIPYEGFAAFEAAVDVLARDPATAAALGAAGHRHTAEQYRWDVVIERYDSLLERVAA